MYLSKLILDPRSRHTRRLLASPYELHKAIARAFPDATDGGTGRVLFRLDEDRHTGRLCLLVQSEKEPEWSKAELLSACAAEPPQNKVFHPVLREGQLLYFRLRANPTVKRNGKRLGLLKEEQQLDWLRRKAEQNGFSVMSCTVIPEGLCRDSKGNRMTSETPLTLLSVRFEGVLRVEQPEAFLRALQNGIGPAKGIGFGLLSAAPIRA